MIEKLFMVLAIFISVKLVFAQNSNVPYITASWDQSSPYNDLCPMLSNGQRAAAGCGAIAIAQVLNYYKLPLTGFGVFNKENESIDLSNINFDWDNILDSYKNNQYNSTQAKAVAELVYITGLSMNMHYGSSSSPRNNGSMMWGLQHHLHLSPSSRYYHRRNFSSDQWKNMIDEQLAAGHPIVYRGTYFDQDNIAYGHIFVIDGKNSDGLYHVNFGHSSLTQDKYVDLDYINQSTSEEVFPGGKQICYNHEQAMIVNCFPEEGKIESDYESHPMILERPFYFEKDIESTSFTSSTGKWCYISYRLKDSSFTGGNVFFEIGAFKDNKLEFILDSNRHNFNFATEGTSILFNTQYRVPKDTKSGTYDLALLYRHDENDDWKLCWDNAKNHMTLDVDGTTIKYNTSESFTNAKLKIQTEIEEIQSNEEGKLFQLKIINDSYANYEDTLMLRFKVDGKIYEHKHTASVYEGCSPIFRLFVPEYEIPLNQKKYEYSAYYYYKAKEEYLPLTTTSSSIESNSLDIQDFPIYVYGYKGDLMFKTQNQSIEQVLYNLSSGIYLIQKGTISKKVFVR